jgi:phosphoglucosamine mutase
MLESALAAGLASAGCDVLLAGVVPTPAVAFLTLDRKAKGGAVVSASHNPVPDNGIKFFSSEGLKVPTDVEAEIASSLEQRPEGLPIGTDVGGIDYLHGGGDRYIEHLLASVPEPLAGQKVVLDCAFGSAYEIGPRAFVEAGAEVITMNAEPDGARINVDCGSTSLDGLAERVVAEGATFGLAFDGDADRVLACDERGVPIDGDQLIALFAFDLHRRGVLKNEVVVATVMANLGFTRLLEGHGIEVIQAPVGDRFVMGSMITSGAVLGGEQSGHIIFAEHATTGDGILAGLQLARIVASQEAPVSRLAAVFERVPQVLINVTVRDRSGLDTAEDLWDQVREIESALGDEGRVLLRPSGTEPLVRVMVEALDPEKARSSAERLAGAVRQHLG